MSSDNEFDRIVQALAEKAVFFADTKAWDPMHMKLTFFLAGARSSNEEDHRSRQLHDWKARLLAARAAGDAAADTTLQAELGALVLAELRNRGDALEHLIQAFPLLTESAAAAQPPEEAEFYYADVFAFVTEYLSPMVRRRINGSSATWCPRWWAHPEAGARLSALWLAWEQLRQEPGAAMSTWWLHHADPHLRVLMDPDMGPFAACSPKDGHTAYPFDPLPLEPYDASQDPLL
ncbi:DUF4913 domain-containing protein [Streptomyces vilmorinianum]|uniref:DUF4913 domain-containing protein n=1 Tax=Streptomyces vilmorinianum TaxID=3051092 RepID=UPI0020C748CB|nr:DUF4913 domain-containing protein [Streptomyces vilmorinianum]